MCAPARTSREWRVLVCGGRYFQNYDAVALVLEAHKRAAPHECLTVLQGGATGADALARVWCQRNYVPYRNYPADWAKYGKAAGPIRNQRMLDHGKPSVVIAFPGGAGTADMVRRAQAAGVTVESIVMPDDAKALDTATAPQPNDGRITTPKPLRVKEKDRG